VLRDDPTKWVKHMKTWSAMIVSIGLLRAAPAFAQTETPGQKQATQDGNSPTTVGPGSKAYKQKSQSLAHSDPGSAYKQKTQSLSHSDAATAKQN
jgi:hypothetical protein